MKLRLKTWAVDEAERCHVKLPAIYARVARGRYPRLVLERVNARVIFVLNPEEQEIHTNYTGRHDHYFRSPAWRRAVEKTGGKTGA